MKVKEIAKLVDGEIVGAPVDETYEVKKAFGCVTALAISSPIVWSRSAGGW